MSNLQYSVIGVLALAAALSVLFFDKRGHAHKPVSAAVAYLTFIQMIALAGAAYLRHQAAAEWLLISGLAVYSGGILIARGNITKVFNAKSRD